jgi:3-methyladenine DNA glycosylase/8-oxoguanine DNA glycosylase
VNRTPRSVRVEIPLPALFSFDAVVRSHGWYDLPPFRYDRPTGVLETRVGSAGVAAPIRFEVDARGNVLVVAGRGLSGRALTALAVRVFALDVDLEASAISLSADPALARALSRGGGRMLRAVSVFEDAVKMLFTTNCSWAATRGMVSRAIALAGAAGEAFPAPEALASFTSARLSRDVRCGYRASALAEFSRRVASGKLDLSRWEDRDRPAVEIRAEIVAQRGFGPYAAEGLLRILGRHDFLALDSWTRQKYRKLYPGPKKRTDGAIARRYARFGQHRGLAMWLDLTRDWHEEKEAVWP